MANLSDNELLALTIILGYKIKFPIDATVKNLRDDIVSKLSDEYRTDETDPLKGVAMTRQESDDFIKSLDALMEANPEFANYTIVDSRERDYYKLHNSTAIEENKIKYEGRVIEDDCAPIVTFKNGDDVVITYWGTTGGLDWYDNVKSGIYKNGTFFQNQALEYAEYIHNRFGFDDITVTGHSKGGNKAQYVALFSDSVSKCVSFDGEGFSLDFVEANKEVIEKNRNKITSISSNCDPVNVLMIIIAGTVKYVDNEGIPSYYLTEKNGNYQYFYYHKPDLMLQTGNGQLRDFTDCSKLSTLINEYSIYMMNIEDKAKRDDAFTLVANVIENALGRGDMNKGIEYIADLKNAEALGTMIAYTFEFLEEKNLSMDDVREMLSEVGINITDNKYVSIIWDAVFDASRELSAEEFTDFVCKAAKWGENHGCDNWYEVVDLIKQDPLLLIDLYINCRSNNLSFEKAIVKLLSFENIASLLSALVQDHPVIACVVSAVAANPVARSIALSLGLGLLSVGTIALIANHIIKNWDSIVNNICTFVEEIKEKVGKFFSDLMEKIKNGIEGFVKKVIFESIRIVEKAKDFVHSVIDNTVSFLNKVKNSALDNIHKLLDFSGGFIYNLASGLFGLKKEPVRIDYNRLRECVERMNAVSARVNSIDRRLDSLYSRLLANDIEQEKGVFTSLVNMYKLMRADIFVDEGGAIRRKALAISSIFDNYNSLEARISNKIPSRLK